MPNDGDERPHYAPGLLSLGAYRRAYDFSVSDPPRFWMQAAEAIAWDIHPTRAMDEEPNGMWKWFPDGRLNTCFNAVDRHVANGHGNRLALVYDSPMTGRVEHYTFAQLQDRVALVAGMVSAQGVVRGDRVLIYMPMVPETVFAMLACARLGAVHSVVFGGFASAELAKRIDDATPSLILTASCGLEPTRIVSYKPLLDAAIAIAKHPVARVIVLQRTQLEADLEPGRDLDWARTIAQAEPVGCVSVASTDPLYILYTSGTTGIPKGVVHDNGGHAVALAWSMPNVYGMKSGETFWAGSDLGWAVGHSYIVYGPLLHGCATILYEGKPVGTPDAGAFWRVVRDHKVDVFFTAPTAIRAIRRDDPEGRHVIAHGIGQLRVLFLAGERADSDTLAWAENVLNIPAVDHWWQTELGWPALATCLGLGETDRRRGSAGRPVPGYRFEVLDSDSKPVPAGEMGEIVIQLPLPPGAFTTLWQKPEHFDKSYLAAHTGYYFTGDAGFADADGFVHIMSRIDDLINVAGHRLSTGAIEQIVASHPDVAECVVCGAADPLKGMVPISLIVLKTAIATEPETVCRQVVELVRNTLGPVAAFKSVAVVEMLPKTRSGKILRSAIRNIADDEPFTMPPTIENPASLTCVGNALTAIGYGRGRRSGD